MILNPCPTCKAQIDEHGYCTRDCEFNLCIGWFDCDLCDRSCGRAEAYEIGWAALDIGTVCGLCEQLPAVETWEYGSREEHTRELWDQVREQVKALAEAEGRPEPKIW